MDLFGLLYYMVSWGNRLAHWFWMGHFVTFTDVSRGLLVTEWRARTVYWVTCFSFDRWLGDRAKQDPNQIFCKCDFYRFFKLYLFLFPLIIEKSFYEPNLYNTSEYGISPYSPCPLFGSNSCLSISHLTSGQICRPAWIPRLPRYKKRIPHTQL